MMFRARPKLSGVVAAVVFSGLIVTGCSRDGLEDLEAVPAQDVATTPTPSNGIPTIGEGAHVEPEVPSAPDNVQIGSWDKAGIAMLGWRPPLESGSSAVLSYHISYLEPGSSTWADLMDIDAASGQDEYWQDIGIATFGTYSFRVTATNAAGTGPAGEAMQVQLN